MPFVPALFTVQCNVRATLHGERIENVLHFRYTADPGPALQSIAQSVETNWRTHVLPNLSADYVLVEVYAVDLTGPNAGVATSPTTPPIPGGDPSPGLPGNAAFVITHRTANRGRGFRGRTYIGGIPENAVVGNTLNTVWASTVVADFVNFVGGVEVDTGGQFVVVSRTANGVPRSSAVVTDVTQILALDLRLDSQRRRLSGRGQ